MKDLSIILDDNKKFLVSTLTTECFADKDEDGEEEVEIEPTILVTTPNDQLIMTLEQAKLLEHDLHSKIMNAREYYLNKVLKPDDE